MIVKLCCLDIKLTFLIIVDIITLFFFDELDLRFGSVAHFWNGFPDGSNISVIVSSPFGKHEGGGKIGNAG